MPQDQPSVSLLEEVKLQAQVLLPVLRALREKLGKAEADKLIGEALTTWSRDLYHRIGAEKPGDARGKWDAIWADLRPRIGDAIDRQMLRDDAEARDYNVTRCSYAEFFKALGEPELGGILLCDIDFHIAEVGEPAIEFRRTQTIMKGAAYCDFRYRLKTGATGD